MKYVSKKRNKTRVKQVPSHPFSESSECNLATNVDPKSGKLTYRATGPSFILTYSSSREENRRLISENFADSYSRLVETIELEYRIASAYFWIIDGIRYAQANPATRLLQGAFAGNLVLINSALELTLDGLYSNARPLMRQAYEAAMIAKICSLDPSSDVYDKWLDGQYIQFTNDILRRILSPGDVEFKRLWQGLSGYTHASYYSGQADFANSPALEEAPLNFIYLHMLLEANYHILCSHIVTDSLRYYEKNWGPNDGVSKDKKQLKSLFREGKVPWMAKSARTFIRHFRATWALK